jgi:predicted AlkP superfamily phosphohydrolase/phosphomutase
VTRATHPLLILGLDGGTLSILRPLIEAGRLPNLGELMAEGWSTELLSTIPTATLPAWTSFLTSASPAQHGVTDIFVPPPDSYGLQPASGLLRRIPTALTQLSAQGYRVCSVGVPGTFPPEAVNGLCVSGFDAPSANRAGPEAVSPPEAFADFQRAGGWNYNVFNEHSTKPDQLQSAADAILSDIQRKEQTTLQLYGQEPWDLFFVHLQASDTVAHHFWHWHDPNSPRASHTSPPDPVARVYERLDQMLGRLREQLQPGSRILVVSDHGFGGASTTAVFLNRWLAEQGQLHFLSPWKTAARKQAGRALRGALAQLPNAVAGLAKKSLKGRVHADVMDLARGTCVDFARSQAFSHELDYAPSIWINQRGIFPAGEVSPEDALVLARQLREALLELRCPLKGHPLIEAVHLRERLAPQPDAALLPDLTIEPAWPDGYRPSFLTSPGPGDVVRSLRPEEWSAPKGFGLPGVHRREGVFMAWGPGIEPMELPVMEIAQAGGLIYPLMGAAIPADLHVPPPAYLEELLPFNTCDDGLDLPPVGALDLGSSKGLRDRLQTMGYID